MPDICIVNIFSQPVAGLLTFLMMSFDERFLILINLYIFYFCVLRSLCHLGVMKNYPTFSSRSFIILAFTLIYTPLQIKFYVWCKIVVKDHLFFPHLYTHLFQDHLLKRYVFPNCIVTLSSILCDPICVCIYRISVQFYLSIGCP